MNNFVWFYSFTTERWERVFVEEIRGSYYWVEYNGQTTPIDKRRILTEAQYKRLKANNALR